MRTGRRTPFNGARIYGGVIGWPSVDAASFAELSQAGLPLPTPEFSSKFINYFVN